jgi:hypothetical protein
MKRQVYLKPVKDQSLFSSYGDTRKRYFGVHAFHTQLGKYLHKRPMTRVGRYGRANDEPM